MVYPDDDVLLLSTVPLPLQGVAGEYKQLSKEMDFMEIVLTPSKGDRKNDKKEGCRRVGGWIACKEGKFGRQAIKVPLPATCLSNASMQKCGL
jgi:hypothetical protein